MVEEDAVALVLDGIAAGDDVDQQPAVRDPVERRGHARRDGRRLQAGPHRDEIAQPLGQRRDRGGDDPGILAAAPGRQQHAVIAELVGGLRDLAQIVEVRPRGRRWRCRDSGRRHGSAGTRGCWRWMVACCS